MKRSLCLVPCLLLTLSTMGGCIVLDLEPDIDATEDQYGNVTLLDTPKMWRDWVQTVDFAVSYEARGNPPLAGEPSWNEYWVSMIEVNRRGREHPEKYVNYIIDERNRLGLPPLEF